MVSLENPGKREIAIVVLFGVLMAAKGIIHQHNKKQAKGYDGRRDSSSRRSPRRGRSTRRRSIEEDPVHPRPGLTRDESRERRRLRRICEEKDHFAAGHTPYQ
ncbi:hypothetical protein AC578_9997 [Pseudocercospora eumusae]|uniref:Uncharacterized protein n=1 Tax=Pseudocercospora eumusae TaxID=321146 RepID=A0A139HME4_9PEZI|nr:hypothetical protein AC578_9997 [Pseudocercospora eumusae]